MQLQYWAQRVTDNAFGSLNLERLKTPCYCMFVPTLSNLLQQSTVFLLAIVLQQIQVEELEAAILSTHAVSRDVI